MRACNASVLRMPGFGREEAVTDGTEMIIHVHYIECYNYIAFHFTNRLCKGNWLLCKLQYGAAAIRL